MLLKTKDIPKYHKFESEANNENINYNGAQYY